MSGSELGRKSRKQRSMCGEAGRGMYPLLEPGEHGLVRVFALIRRDGDFELLLAVRKISDLHLHGHAGRDRSAADDRAQGRLDQRRSERRGEGARSRGAAAERSTCRSRSRFTLNVVRKQGTQLHVLADRTGGGERTACGRSRHRRASEGIHGIRGRKCSEGREQRRCSRSPDEHPVR